jgi:riboflavin kinase/FMN adenylyltransferase
MRAGGTVKTAVLGGFDGIHLGHRHLIERAGGDPMVVCMEPLPRQVIAGSGWSRRLTTPGERRKALHDMGIMSIIAMPFHRGLMDSTPGEFAAVLAGIDSFQRIAVGWDFRYGRNRCGGSSDLAETLPGVEVLVVPPFLVEGRPVKSERIRVLIEEGSLRDAETLLGRRYGCLGVVARGRGRGRELGFPTMNVVVPRSKLLPPPGSYAVQAAGTGSEWSGAAFRQPGANCVEVHIPGFQGENYGRVVEVSFVEAIRKPASAGSDERLRELIRGDVNAAMEVMEKWQ